jgi:hypothetical protein
LTPVMTGWPPCLGISIGQCPASPRNGYCASEPWSKDLGSGGDPGTVFSWVSRFKMNAVRKTQYYRLPPIAFQLGYSDKNATISSGSILKCFWTLGELLWNWNSRVFTARSLKHVFQIECLVGPLKYKAIEARVSKWMENAYTKWPKWLTGRVFGHFLSESLQIKCRYDLPAIPRSYAPYGGGQKEWAQQFGFIFVFRIWH